MAQYTIGELMAIDAGRKERASGCSVNLIKTFHEIKPESLLDKFKSFFLGHNIVKGYYVIFKLSVLSDKGNTHTVFIRLDPDFDLNKWQNNKVQVYCDCADFKYRSAYILEKRKSLFLTDRIKLALGQALTDAPKGKVATSLLCKHAYAALEWVVGNYSSLMRTI